MSPGGLSETLLSLPVAERIALADRLYASVPEEWRISADEAWLEEAERRSAEMDADPSAELSLEEFMTGLKSKVRGA
jgi:putative addiction module component (TIGR02574 family)